MDVVSDGSLRNEILSRIEAYEDQLGMREFLCAQDTVQRRRNKKDSFQILSEDEEETGDVFVGHYASRLRWGCCAFLPSERLKERIVLKE